ncbi:MAG: fused MFS/spermidine synthase, partial [Planctomycetota bacterium]
MSEPAKTPAAPRWLSARIQILVFIGGAAFMALEIAGSRVLAPHFGSSLFIWGGLIAVFLLALSVGSFLGGWVGDNYPDLMSLCLAVG